MLGVEDDGEAERECDKAGTCRRSVLSTRLSHSFVLPASVAVDDDEDDALVDESRPDTGALLWCAFRDGVAASGLELLSTGTVVPQM